MRRIHKTLSPLHFSRGFSLVEMMITSTIGLMLLSAVVGMFMASNHTAKETSIRGGLYENGRYALMNLSSELRAADFWGGAHSIDISARADLAPIAVDCSGAAVGYDLSVSLWAMNADSANAFGCINDAKLNSDILVIKHVAQLPTPVGAISASRTYIMSNETKGIIFDGADALPTTVDGGDVPGGQAWEYSNIIYYVSNNSDGVPTLYRKRLVSNTWGTKEEVAVGVERLHVEFGVDTSGDGVADSFRNAASVDWNNVVAARVYLLVRSEKENPAYVDKKTYHMGSVTVNAANDHYNRLVFDTSINLRNRKLMVAGGY